MTTSTELDTRPAGGQQLITREYLQEKRELIREQLAPEATDAEMELFLEVCAARGLNPITRQIYAIHRKDKRTGKMKMSIQTGIDGFRLVAQRTGALRGQVGPEWCGPDGVWRDVWLDQAPPAAARVGVLRAGWDEPLYAVALWSEYAATYQDGNPSGQWAVRGAHMLAKCAAALALRSAFPEDLSGVYTDDEMQQADTPRPTATAVTAAVDVGKQRAWELINRYGQETVVSALKAAGITSADLADDDTHQRALGILDAADDGEAVSGDVTHQGDDDPVISSEQNKALWDLAEKAGLSTSELRAIVEDVTGSKSTKDVRQSQRAEVAGAIETAAAAKANAAQDAGDKQEAA